MPSMPWHFWPIVVLAFVWYLIGAIDYVATQFELEFWVQTLNRGQAAFVERLPEWAVSAWAIAVWAGLAGVLLLAARARFAPLVLFVSALGLVIVAVWATLFPAPPVEDVVSTGAEIVLIGSAIFGIFLWLYARWLHRRGRI